MAIIISSSQQRFVFLRENFYLLSLFPPVFLNLFVGAILKEKLYVYRKAKLNVWSSRLLCLPYLYAGYHIYCTVFDFKIFICFCGLIPNTLKTMTKFLRFCFQQS